MRTAVLSAFQRVVRILSFAGLAIAMGASAQQLVTDDPVAAPGGTAYVGKWSATSIFSAGPAFHFTAPVTITSITYDPGPGGVQELGIATVNGCVLNQTTPTGTVCDVETTIISRFPGMRYGILRVATTSGVFTLPVSFLSVGAQVVVTPGVLTTLGGNDVAASSLTVDAKGNVYFTNSDLTVRKIDAITGAVSIFAGSPGNASGAAIDGDGGAATAAHLGVPVDVTASPAGDVYLVSSLPLANDSVRKVSGATGTISTVSTIVSGRGAIAGNSDQGTDGAVVVDDQGNIYTSVRKNTLVVTLSDGSKKDIIGVDPISDKGCNGGDVYAYAPTTLAVSGGYVYFESSAKVYKISTDAIVCHAPVLVAGTGAQGNSGDGGLATQATFESISGIAVDAAGDVYIADAASNSVRMVSAATGTVTTIAGANSALPQVTVSAGWASLALDVRGNLFVLGQGGVVQEITMGTGALSYANTTVGQVSSDSPKSVVFSNIGNDALSASASNPSLAANDFALNAATTSCGTGNATTLAAGASCAAAVDFKPMTVGAVQGTLAIGGVEVALHGNGEPVKTTVNISPNSIDFGTLALAKSSSVRTIIVTNTGSSALLVASATLSDTTNFAMSNGCIGSVPVNGSCSIAVTFKPHSTGAANATITLFDNADSNTQAIALTGQATDASYSVTVNPNELTIQQGQSGTAQFVFAPTGGFKGAVSFACTGLPAGVSCNFASATLTADGSDKQQVSQLTVTAQGGSNASAQNTVSGRGMTLASLLGFNGMLLTWLKLRRKGALSMKLMGLLLLMSLGVAGAAGCGAGGTPASFTAASSTTVSVVTTSAADGSTQTATFVLTVK